MEHIGFYEREFYPLSNFSSFMIRWGGEDWMTSEHAYHAEKFKDYAIRTEIRKSRSAHDALMVSRKYAEKIRPDWDEVKVKVMKEILYTKLIQNPYVRKKLMETGDKLLIEDSWRDDFWGWGPNKDGKNQLGKLWMEIREELIHRYVVFVCVNSGFESFKCWLGDHEHSGIGFSTDDIAADIHENETGVFRTIYITERIGANKYKVWSIHYDTSHKDLDLSQPLQIGNMVPLYSESWREDKPSSETNVLIMPTKVIDWRNHQFSIYSLLD